MLLLSLVACGDDASAGDGGGGGGGSTPGATTTTSTSTATTSTSTATSTTTSTGTTVSTSSGASPVSCDDLRAGVPDADRLVDLAGAPCVDGEGGFGGTCTLARADTCETAVLDCEDDAWTVSASSACGDGEVCGTCTTDDCDSDCTYSACHAVAEPPIEDEFRCGDTNCARGEQLCLVDYAENDLGWCGELGTCASLPDGCTDCACVVAAWPTDHCIVSCDEDGEGGLEVVIDRLEICEN